MEPQDTHHQLRVLIGRGPSGEKISRRASRWRRFQIRGTRSAVYCPTTAPVAMAHVVVRRSRDAPTALAGWCACLRFSTSANRRSRGALVGAGWGQHCGDLDGGVLRYLGLPGETVFYLRETAFSSPSIPRISALSALVVRSVKSRQRLPDAGIQDGVPAGSWCGLSAVALALLGVVRRAQCRPPYSPHGRGQ